MSWLMGHPVYSQRKLPDKLIFRLVVNNFKQRSLFKKPRVLSSYLSSFEYRKTIDKSQNAEYLVYYIVSFP